MEPTPRQALTAELLHEVRLSKLSDVQRAVIFLQRARDVRKGCRVQRNASKKAQSEAWKKGVDSPAHW